MAMQLIGLVVVATALTAAVSGHIGMTAELVSTVVGACVFYTGRLVGKGR